MNNTETIKKEESPEVAEKPYTFRTLGTSDVFVMFKIISAIGINEFADCLDSDKMKELLKNGGSETEDFAFTVGVSMILEVANVIFGNIGKCEKEIYQILSQTSNLSVKEVKDLDAVVFFEMIIDFIRKDEFKDFIRVVSKLFK